MPTLVFNYGERYFWEPYAPENNSVGNHKVTFDGPNRLILVNEEVVTLDVEEDIYSNWKEWVQWRDSGKFLPAFSTTGGDPITSTESLAGTFFLENGWRIKPWKSRNGYILNIVGNLYTREEGGNPVIPESGVSISLTRSSIVTVITPENTITASDVWAYDSRTLTTSAAPTVEQIADGVWNATSSSYVTSDTTGKTLNDINTESSGSGTQLDTIETKIDSIDTNVDTINTNVSTIDGKVDTIDTNVDTINTNVSTIDGKVDTINTNVSTIDGKVDTIDTNVDTINTNVSTIDGKVDTINTNVSTIDVTVSSLDTSITSIEPKINDIHGQIQRAIYIDTELGVNGNGDQQSPYNNVTDAIDDAELAGLRKLVFLSDAVLDRNLKNFEIFGIGHPEIDCNGQQLDKSEFHAVELSGSMTTNNKGIRVYDCQFRDGFSGFDGEAFNVGFQGVFTFASGTNSEIINCYSAVAGSGRPTINSGGGTSSLSIRDYRGGANLGGVVSGDSVTFSAVESKITLLNTNTGGFISVRGISQFTDNSAGTTVDRTALINPVEARLAQELLEADQSFDKDAGLLHYYRRGTTIDLIPPKTVITAQIIDTSITE
jgi:outer membrane murein-binding lipoprotein Lpp